LNECE
jgi:hypothetical protein